MSDLIQWAADALFMPWTVLLLFGTGLYLSFRTGFIQVRRSLEAARTVLGGQDQGGGALTYIAVSDSSWYWQNRLVVSLNRSAQRVIKPLIIFKTPLKSVNRSG